MATIFSSMASCKALFDRRLNLGRPQRLFFQTIYTAGRHAGQGLGYPKQFLAATGLVQVARQGKVILNTVRFEFNSRIKIGEGVVRVVCVIGIEVWVELLQTSFRYGDPDDG